jgi:hypothetical protein
MKISLSTVPVRVIRRAGQFCIARWRSGLPELSSSQADWRLGKRRAILWNPIENPFGFRFQPRLGQHDKHFCSCPGPSVFDRSYLHPSRSKTSRSCRVALPDPKTHRPRMRQQQEHQQRPDKRHILREIDPVDLLHLRVVYLPVGVYLERHA